MKCHDCHKGTVTSLARAGRTAPYKSIPNLAVPADLEIQTCDHCGEEWMTPEDAMRIDAAMDIVYRRELLHPARTSSDSAVNADATTLARCVRDLTQAK